MSTKLSLATVAAMAFQASAVTTTIQTEDAVSPAQSLINIYDLCKIQVTDATTSHYSALMGDVQMRPNFKFSGIDENCPTMEATIWYEPPPACAQTAGCDADGVKVTLTDAEIRLGSYDTKSTFPGIIGDWYMHVTITPTGFDCAMPITDTCMLLDEYCDNEIGDPCPPAPQCEATIENFTAVPANNNDDEQYIGDDGMTHTLNWTVPSVWGCDNLCTYTTVRPHNDIGDVDGSRTWVQVMGSAGSPVTQVLTGHTTYAKIDYEVCLKDCTTGEVEVCKQITKPNPFPPCSAGGQLVHVDVGHSVNQLIVDQQWINSYTYTCRQFDLFAELVNGYEKDTVYTANNTLYFNDDEVYRTLPTNYPTPLVWADLPINVTSRVEVTGRWKTSDVDPSYVYHVDAWGTFHPPCNYEVGANPSFNYTIIDGADINSHRIKFDYRVQGKYSRFCPTFGGHVKLTLDGTEIASTSVSASDMLTLWHEDDTKPFDLTTLDIKSYETGFMDGVYCVEFTMTPDSDVNAGDGSTSASNIVCHTVNAKPCQLTSKCALNYNHDKNDQEYDFTADAEAEFNAWCDPSRFAYTYQYKLNDDALWTNAMTDSTLTAATDLPANQKTTHTWSVDEQDYKIQTEFTVAYQNTTFTSQTGVTPNVSQCLLEVPHYCRPGMLQDPTLKLTEKAQSLGVSVTFTDATQAYNVCGNMSVKVEVYYMSPEPIPDPQIIKTEEYTSNVPAAGQSITYDFDIPDVEACYLVKVTYGHDGTGAETVVRNSLQKCHPHKCVLDAAALTFVDAVDAADQNSRVMNFKYDASWGKYCEDVSAQVCVQDKAQTITKFCSSVFDVVTGRTIDQAKSVSAQAAQVTQSRDFDKDVSQQYTAVITVSDAGDDPKAKSVTARTAMNFTVPLPPQCPNPAGQATFALDGEFLTDTLKQTTIKGSLSGTSGLMCGAQSYCYEHPSTGVETCSSTVATKQWVVPSFTQDYTITGKVTFANSNTTVDLAKVLPWEQGCRVQVGALSVVSHQQYDADAGKSANLKVRSRGSIVGHCGDVGQITIVGSLTDEDGTVQTDTLDVAGFNTTDANGGVDSLFDVSKFSGSYTWHVTINAGGAPSIAYHQSLTTQDTGYIQVLQDASQAVGSYDPNDPSPKDLVFVTKDPVCNVVVKTLEITGFREKEDCSDRMIATIAGTINSEISCLNVVGQVKLITVDDGITVGSAQPTLTMDNSDPTMTVWSFTTEIETANDYGEYKANLAGYDSTNEADKSTMDSQAELWEPLCCLAIPTFTKVAQDTSLDGLRTDLSYTVALSQHGDNACRDSAAKISMQDSTGKNTFVHFLSSDDTEQALNGGFNYTVTVSTTGSNTAVVDWVDSRAIQNQTATATGFVDSGTTDCKVNVVDFCIDDAKSVSTGRWSFEFRIRAEANAACGHLSVDLDLIKDQSTYLGHVTIPGDQIVDSFNCDCVKTFTVEADFDGQGEVYGQLDVRNSAHQVVQITDSCTWSNDSSDTPSGSSASFA